MVARDRLRQLMATKPQLGDTILAAFVARRTLLLTGAAPAIRVIGSQFSPESLRVREFLARTRVPYEWLDPDRDPQVEDVLRGFGIAANELPVVIATGSVLRRPTPGELASYLGLTIESLPERCFDLVVVGGGPAGLAAAVYGASEGLRTLGVEMTAPGGQAGASSRIENYLGFPMGISGSDLTQRAVIQAEKFGANLTVPCTAESLRNQAGHLVVRLSDGSDVAGRAVIAATGAAYRRLEASRLSDFEGNGVYYAATEMESRMCGIAPVVVVGGGNSAGQAAIFLSQSGCAVTLVIRALEPEQRACRAICLNASRQILTSLSERARLLSPWKETRPCGPCVSRDPTAKPSSNAPDCSPSSEPILPLAGCLAAQPLDERGFVLTDLSLTPISSMRAGRRSGGSRCRSKPATRASSPSVTCARDRPSGWRRPSARARRRCDRSTSTLPFRLAKAGHLGRGSPSTRRIPRGAM